MSRQYSIDEIVEISASAVGKTFGEIDVNDRLSVSGNKGKLGHVIEEGLFLMEPNSRQEPDFEKAGVELKVTPYKWVRNNKQISSKERLVLTMVNFLDDYKYNFYQSHCFSKLRRIQLFFYEHVNEKLPSEFLITGEYLFDYQKLTENDKRIIEKDFLIIMDRIKRGEAHLISEADTYYLSACTKSSDSSVRVQQPFNEVLAKPRAYSLKTGFMTELLRTRVFPNAKSRDSFIEGIIGKNETIETIIRKKSDRFKGKSVNEISTELSFDLNMDAKNYLRVLISRMLGVNTNRIEDLDEFAKAGIILKTIRVQMNGRIKESMSFPTFKFTDIVEEEWINSTLRNYLTDHKFLFAIFDENESAPGQYVFRETLLWSISDAILDSDVKKVWDETVRVINEGVIITEKNGRKYNNFPGSSFNDVMHVRPHAQNREDVYPLPDGSYLTKQSFWFNNGFIEKQIQKI